MINKLKEPHFIEAVKFLHQYLFDAVKFTEVPDQYNCLIEFLIAEGVLTPADSSLNIVRLSSPLVDIYFKMDILLELFSHASQTNQSNLEEHFNHALSYSNNLATTIIWIMHFTCKNRYYKAENPMYQSKEQKIQELIIVHFWHNEKFDNIQMYTYLKND
ncbi:2959_t:CDS:2 [Funneliformis mosseae]|uniref:2959_t:CDS:1 n=1 Tax=Funneliformis mosseae TaxID=27381 RepID=A0A9N9HJR1_FUNMO|nr:2959_t:CDS:2 [Funneliformis mosseae]